MRSRLSEKLSSGICIDPSRDAVAAIGMGGDGEGDRPVSTWPADNAANQRNTRLAALALVTGPSKSPAKIGANWRRKVQLVPQLLKRASVIRPGGRLFVQASRTLLTDSSRP
jgi:hypothetical protein